MASFNKFNAFVGDLGKKVHDLSSDTLKVMLTNVQPLATNAVKADITELGAGNGYAAGGNVAALTSWSASGGTWKLVLADPAAWVASGGTLGPFRWAVLYNSTPGAGPLIGWWEYPGAAITLQIGEPFTTDLDPAAGVLTLA